MSNAAQTATIPSDLEAAREAFIARFDNHSAAMAFETHVLGIGREFLPECALAVRDNQDAATVEYYAWLLEQANEAHDAADGDDGEGAQAEDARLLTDVERLYEAAKGQWTGRSWDDGDKVTPESTDEQIEDLNIREGLRVTCWGVDESTREGQAWLRRVHNAVIAVEEWREEHNGADLTEAYEKLRELAAESDASVAAQAAIAETSASEALANARRGFKHTGAGPRRARRQRPSAQFGDAPTWGPFCDAVRAWSEHGE
jgi:hypothetical protein